MRLYVVGQKGATMRAFDWRQKASQLRESAKEHRSHAEVLFVLADDCETKATELETHRAERRDSET